MTVRIRTFFSVRTICLSILEVTLKSRYFLSGHCPKSYAVRVSYGGFR